MAAKEPDTSSIRVVRLGHGANCSSIGSVVDTLFVTSLLGGALFAACVGALGREPVEIVGEGGEQGTKGPKEEEAPGSEPRSEPPP